MIKMAMSGLIFTFLPTSSTTIGLELEAKGEKKQRVTPLAKSHESCCSSLLQQKLLICVLRQMPQVPHKGTAGRGMEDSPPIAHERESHPHHRTSDKFRLVIVSSPDNPVLYMATHHHSNPHHSNPSPLATLTIATPHHHTFK